ncbi:Pfs, NACHT and ankyrin domain protein, partial [Aureobasidium melanogenum]
MEKKKKLSHDDYTVAWICPLEVEQVAALEMLDEEHQRLPQPENDHNVYNLGSILNHNVVIAGRGIPGCGKTVLSSTIIEDLRLNDRDTGPAIVYFFFSFSDESKQKLDHMLRSLISQLVRWDGSTGAHLSKLFESSYHGRLQPQMTQLVELFNQMTSELQDIIVVLDALDESKDRRDLLRWITSSSNQACKFILTSRSEREIEECFASWLPPNSTITLESDLVGDDIEAYVHHRLKEEEHLSRWTSMHEEIVNILVGKAAGMFRWVYCQLQELSECLDKPAVRRMLQTLPNDLNETYDRILQNIPRPRVPNAIKLLQLLTFSTRSLSLREVIDAMATEPDMDLPFDLENRISPPEAIIGYCSSLVRIADAPGDSYTRKHSKILQPAHFSVREYLLLEREKTPYNHFLETKVANAAIARISLAYLWTISETQSLLRLRRVNPVLIKLAARFWMDHAAAAGEEEEITFAWTRKIFTNGSFLQYWARLYNGSKTPHVLPALYYASQFALHRSVDYLLSIGADPNAQGEVPYGASVNAQGGFFGSALHAAAWNGHIDTLQLLLKYGADVSAMKWQHGSTSAALQVAAYRGHVEIVKALLMHGADVNACNAQISYEGGEPSYTTRHYTALEAASYKGHIEVVKILLKNNAKVDASGSIHFTKGSRRDRSIFSEGYTYGTPLQAASSNGYLGIVRILVASGANVNIESGHLGYALHAALSRAHMEVSLFLIESGADVQARGGFHGTALHAAVYEGGLAMVQLLLKNGVDIDKADDSGETALYGACKTGSVRIVELLLDNGADVNLPGGDYGTALCAAINSGSLQTVQMVRLLLDYGADVNARGGNHGTALRAAYMSIFGGTRRIEEIMQVLLDKGADPNAQNEGDDTLLYMACDRKDLSVAAMLLAHGADPNVQGGELGTALAAAAYKGSLEMVQTLLNNGADPNARKDGGNTPLYIAAYSKDLAIATILLANGANPNVQGGELGTALAAAFRQCSTKLVQMLLESGADPNARNEGDDTLLYMASYDKNSAMAAMLLEFGADPNVQGGNIGTALDVASYRDSLDLIQLLLENGADVNSQSGCHGNALQSSCCPDSDVINPDLIQLLLDNGASITTVPASTHKAESMALRCADVNAPGGKYYDCALCAAAYKGHTNIVRILLEEGAVAGTSTDPYDLALQDAVEGGNKDIVDLLFEEGVLKSQQRTEPTTDRANNGQSQQRTEPTLLQV